MKHVAEKDRKFTDMGGVKIFHSIYPVTHNPEGNDWGPVIRFDHKILLPGRQEVQHIIGLPVQVIRVVINGSADYFDSSGYRTVIGEQDTLAINSGKEMISAVLQNTDDQADTELLEIWLSSPDEERSYQFHSGPGSPEKGRFYTMISIGNEEGDLRPQQKKWLRVGSFGAGAHHVIPGIIESHLFIFFVANGEMDVNGQHLNYGDTALLSDETSFRLNFEKDTKLFIMEIGKEEARP